MATTLSTPRQKLPRTRSLVVTAATSPVVVRNPDSLRDWIDLYLSVEAGGKSENTRAAKRRDLDLFLNYFHEHARSDHPHQWTKSVSEGFLKFLERDLGRKPTTVNRILSSLRHCSGWVHRFREFLAGDPCAGIKELTTDDPDWKGLSDAEVVRLKSAAEQLLKLKTRRNQLPIKGYSIFLLLLHTGLRVSELTGLDRDQYRGKHLYDVKRKGKIRTRKVFLPQNARDALDDYLAADPHGDGPLFRTKSGGRLERQDVDNILKEIAGQANGRLMAPEHIRVSAHVLRHTFLRKVAQEHGVPFAMEAAGHASSKYIFRYVKPSDAEKEKALDNLF